MIKHSFPSDVPRPADYAVLAEFLIHWTECLHGTGSLRDMLGHLTHMTGARVALVHRDCLATGRQRTVASVDTGAAAGERPLAHVLGASLIGADPRTIVPGTLWTLGELEPVRQDRLERRTLNWMDDRGLREAAVVPLGLDGDVLDVLEFYMVAPISAGAGSIRLLSRLAAIAWARRNKGRIARLLRASPAINKGPGRPDPTANPLSADNPWRLTAAEMRICALIHSGIAPADIGNRISVSSSTVRSHLRSIYAKGRVPGQVGLVRQLMMMNGPAERSDTRAASA